MNSRKWTVSRLHSVVEPFLRPRAERAVLFSPESSDYIMPGIEEFSVLESRAMPRAIHRFNCRPTNRAEIVRPAVNAYRISPKI